LLVLRVVAIPWIDETLFWNTPQWSRLAYRESPRTSAPLYRDGQQWGRTATVDHQATRVQTRWSLNGHEQS
jgi:hypothetical protein